MPRLEISNFGGMVPRRDAKNLAENQATIATNCNFNAGTLKPMFTYESGVVSQLVQYDAQTLAYTGSQLLSLSGYESIVPPVDTKPLTRFYYTRSGIAYCARNMDIDPSLGYGTTKVAPGTAGLELGIAPPSVAPVALEGSGGEDPNDDLLNDETRFYVYTFVNEFGWESAPSPISNELLVTSPDASVAVRFPQGFMDDRDIAKEKLTKLRLYRSSTTGESAGFFLVQEFALPLSTSPYITEFTDTIPPSGGSGDTYTAGSAYTLDLGATDFRIEAVGQRESPAATHPGIGEVVMEWTSAGSGTVTVGMTLNEFDRIWKVPDREMSMYVYVNGSLVNQAEASGDSRIETVSVDITVALGDVVKVKASPSADFYLYDAGYGEPSYQVVDHSGLAVPYSYIKAGTVTGGTGGDPGSSTTYYVYQDAVENLGPLLASENHYPPEGEIRGLLYSSYGVMYAWSDDGIINVSETFLPYAFNPDNQLKLEGKVMGMGETYSGVVVVTDQKPYFITGTTPFSLSLVQFDAAYACYDGGVGYTNAPHVVDMGEAVLYMSYEGIVAVSSNGAQLMSEPVYAPEDLKPMMNDKLFALRMQDKYLMFTDQGSSWAIVLDPSTGEVMDWYGARGDAAFFHGQSNTLFTWDGNYTRRILAADFTKDYEDRPLVAYQWQSKQFFGPEVSMSCVKLEGQDFSGIKAVTFTMNYANGSTYTKVLNADDGVAVFRLPPVRTRDFTFSLSGRGEVHRLVMATSMEELA
ncbi:hypothetical protein [Ferrimonas balearica]|uniref:hypothetical protein n=1 Tax=Ferrimonas balearica TaxID=44012 RepID=UPI001F3631D3|nr:hypothetical protein [Ferrimonas balearica]MBY6093859.1 hypothetical protein [Ferrimonas balearica]